MIHVTISKSSGLSRHGTKSDESGVHCRDALRSDDKGIDRDQVLASPSVTPRRWSLDIQSSEIYGVSELPDAQSLQLDAMFQFTIP
jgi:hypothetical protein